MAAPLGTAEIPVFIRFDGLEHQVGTIELDVLGEVTPQVKSAERAIAHALAPCETEQAAPEDTAALPWDDATPYDPEAVHDALNMAARYGQLGALRLLRTIFHPDAWAAALQDPAPVVHLSADEGPKRTWGEIDLFRAGLLTIATRGCEATRQGDCWSLGRTADARYGADLACAACVARRVLDGEQLPTGPGEHANERAPFAQHLGDGSEDYRR